MKIKNMQNTPIKSGEELFEFIPQRPPFVMVDKLYEVGGNYAKSGFLISPDNLLVNGNRFQEGGLVENIAQTAAMFAGLKKAEQGKEMPIGYIAGIKNLKIQGLPSVNEEIYTKITLTNDLMNIQIVEGEVQNSNGSILASCELRIFLKDTI